MSDHMNTAVGGPACSKCGSCATKNNPIERENCAPVCANCWCATEPLVDDMIEEAEENYG